MIQIVMKPVPGEGVVNRETLYAALFNGEDVGLKVRGLRASHAEAKMMAIFRAQLKGKTVSYDLEAYEKNLDDRRKEDCDGETEEPAPEEGAAHEEPGVRDEEVPELPRFPPDGGDVGVRPQ